MRRMWGHFWTVAPRVRLLPPSPIADLPWALTVPDPRRGPVTLRGRHLPGPPNRPVLVAIHGLGGTVESLYVQDLARACVRRGVGCLRIGMRGAGGDGADLYHAGLSTDVLEALQSPALQRYSHAIVVGYSLGGHIALRTALDAELGTGSQATSPPLPLRGVLSVCPPLDLELASHAFDSAPALYRRHILNSLIDDYHACAARGPVPTDVARVARVKSIREWDRLTVAPRFGFTSESEYYAAVSVAPQLHRLRASALVIHGDGDPIVTPDSIRPGLRGAPGLRHAWLPGGHVGLAPWARLPDETGATLADQLVSAALNMHAPATGT